MCNHKPSQSSMPNHTLSELQMRKLFYLKAYNEFVSYSTECYGLKFTHIVHELNKRLYDRLLKQIYKLIIYNLRNKLKLKLNTNIISNNSPQELYPKISYSEINSAKNEISNKLQQQIIIDKSEKVIKNKTEKVVENKTEKVAKKETEKVVEQKAEKVVEQKAEKVVEKETEKVVEKEAEKVVEKEVKKIYKRIGKKCKKCNIDAIEKNYGFCENCRKK